MVNSEEPGRKHTFDFTCDELEAITTEETIADIGDSTKPNFWRGVKSWVQ